MYAMWAESRIAISGCSVLDITGVFKFLFFTKFGLGRQFEIMRYLVVGRFSTVGDLLDTCIVEAP
jgi:hypothetical protein